MSSDVRPHFRQRLDNAHPSFRVVRHVFTFSLTKKSPHSKTLDKSFKKNFTAICFFFIFLIRSFFLCFVLISDQDASEHKPICSVCQALSIYSFLPFFCLFVSFTYFPVKYNNVDFFDFLY
jgi:hypothetical protein